LQYRGEAYRYRLLADCHRELRYMFSVVSKMREIKSRIFIYISLLQAVNPSGEGSAT